MRVSRFDNGLRRSGASPTPPFSKQQGLLMVGRSPALQRTHDLPSKSGASVAVRAPTVSQTVSWALDFVEKQM